MPTNTRQSETLSVAEVAELLGVSLSHAHRLIRQTGSLGPIRPIRLGRRIRFGRAQVDALLSGEEA